MLQDKLKVLVTGVGGGGHGHEIVKALRLTHRYVILGVDMSPVSLGLVDVDEAYTIPPASHPHYIETLLDICRTRGIAAVFHGSEPELKVLSQQRHLFQDQGIFLPLNSQAIINLGMDKWATMTSLQNHGFPIPATSQVSSPQDIPRNFPLPAVVKPAVGGGGSNNLFLAQDQGELEYACRYLHRQEVVAIIQQYLGTPDDEYTVGVLHTLEGNFIGSFALRRYILSGLSNRIKVPNRTGQQELSPLLAISSGVSQGEVQDFPEIRQACENIATALNSRGPMNIQCRFVAGKVYPFEINPRFSGTTYIRALMGFNEPDLLLRHHVLRETLPSPIPYQYGYVMRGLREEVISQPKQNWLMNQ